MIKVTGKRPIRSTTASYITDEGETVEITVEYFSANQAYQKDRLAAARKADAAYVEKVDEYEAAVEKHRTAVAAAKATGKAEPKPLKLERPFRFIFEYDDLVNDVHALIDPDGKPFADENGKPMKITAENLDKIDNRNLRSIRQAILDDIAGKKSQPAS